MIELYKIIQQKGYKGPNSIDSIVNWFAETYGIYFSEDVEFIEDNGTLELFGYFGKIYMKPYQAVYKMFTYASREDLFYAMFLKVISLGYV